MTQTHQYQIMGAYFRRRDQLNPVPAQTLLECLPLGTALWLRAEPTNQFDENAIRVMMTGSVVPREGPHHEALEARLPDEGFDLAEICARDEIHLGYIPKEVARALRQGRVLDLWAEGAEPHLVRLALTLDGKPAVRWTND